MPNNNKKEDHNTGASNEKLYQELKTVPYQGT